MRCGLFNYNQGRWGASQTELMDDLLAQIVLAEELGLEDCWFTEHHFSDYSVLPVPNLVIAAAAQRTMRMRFGNLVNVLPFHDPLRLAEETAVLDQLSHGRIGLGIGRGVRRDEFERLHIPLEDGRGMFEEAIDVVLKAWREDHWSHAGKYWQYTDISLRPLPYQRPHPPVYVGVNSQESVIWAAERGFHLANHLSTLQIARDNVETFRAHYRGAGAGEFIVAREIVVAETDDEARALGRQAMQEFWRLFAQEPLGPPEPVADETLARYTARFRYLARPTHADLENDGVIVLGSPATVARRLAEMCAVLRPDVLLGVFSFGGLTHDQVCRSIRLFAREVVPMLPAAPAQQVV